MLMKKILLAFALSGSAVAGVAGIAAADSSPQAPTAGKLEGKEKWEARKKEMLARFDTNHDGKLDDAERKVMRDTLATEEFKKMDTNGDGMVSLDEFKAFKASQPKHARRFGRHHRGDKQVPAGPTKS